MMNLQRTLLGAAAACVLSLALAAAHEGAVALAQQADTPSGDSSRGKALVESSGCFDCHRIGDRGSRLGPDLSGIGARRTTVHSAA